MTQERHKHDPIEAALRAGHYSEASPAETPTTGDLAAWIEAPDESATHVEALLARDADLRSVAVDLRLHGFTDGPTVGPDLRGRVHALMPAPPPVLARIGAWAAAAAAAILLAIGGWHLGSGDADVRSLGTDTVAAAAFGVQDGSDEYSALLLGAQGTVQ
ncbi:MAG: hypothetical protein QF733_04640 [Phycisphaerales bacterium]|jgi:hypothetical protein|nr:hypothetical protein [Phycisphaerales bacterium]